jgi:anti-sigma regulatory factor (Ser/Thr protein kinase)
VLYAQVDLIEAGKRMIAMSTLDQAARIRLGLSSRAENVTVVRQALSGFADATGLTDGSLNDIGTAVTEACNNASAHAYGGGDGPLSVELEARDATMVVTVRDRGVGLALDGGSPVEFPSNVDGELAGIGVPSIKALASSVRWSEPAGGGTEVEMTFSTGPLAWEGSGLHDGLREPGAGHLDVVADAIEVAMVPMSVARSVLPRLLRVMASRAQFSVERHVDIQRVVAVVLGADTASWLSCGVEARLVADRRSLDVAIGPVSEEDVAWLTAAASAIEPKLRMSTESLYDGSQRLVLNL